MILVELLLDKGHYISVINSNYVFEIYAALLLMISNTVGSSYGAP